MLKISELRKKFVTKDGDITALNGISLSIDDGDFVAIVGKSGSGKTTLLNMIAGLDAPDSGCISFDGAEITGMTADAAAVFRRQKIGVIYQFYNLIPELTVRENIVLPAELDGKDIDGERLSDILSTVGLFDRESAYPDTLSGGQQQRVAIARALYSSPALILADEPTGNLDRENSAEVLRLLREMNEAHGVTVIVVTHSDEVSAAAHRVITISDGRITGDEKREASR